VTRPQLCAHPRLLSSILPLLHQRGVPRLSCVTPRRARAQAADSALERRGRAEAESTLSRRSRTGALRRRSRSAAIHHLSSQARQGAHRCPTAGVRLQARHGKGTTLRFRLGDPIRPLLLLPRLECRDLRPPSRVACGD
jgi:hypothetical protein